MDDKSSPESNGNNRLPPPSLNQKQIELSRRIDGFYQKNNLKPLKPKPSEIFIGAIYGMQGQLRSNPDWISQVAGSLRELLYPIWYEVRRHNRHNKGPLIKDKFKQFGYVFIEDVFDEVNEVYGRLNDLAHHGLDPQVFTGVELNNFSENDFEKLVSRFENLMFQAFTLTLDIFKQIDQIFSKIPAEHGEPKILKEEIKRLTKERAAQEYLYYKADERWLDWLWKNGFLDVIKQKAEDPTRYGYRTPEVNYLVKVSEKEPAKVVDIMLQVPIYKENFNPEVVDRFMRICSTLPAAELKRMVNKIRGDGWVPLMGAFNNWGFEYEKMLKILADANDYENILLLSEAILTVRSKEKVGKEGFANISTENPFYFKDLSYAKVFERLASVGNEYAERALGLTVKVMSQIVRLGCDAKKGEVFPIKETFHLFDVDFFTLELGEKERLSHRDDVRELAAVIKQLARKTIGSYDTDPWRAQELYKKYFEPLPDSRSMWRLRLFVLTLYPNYFKDELKKVFFRLFEVDNYHELISGTEYLKALRAGFPILSGTDKREYVKRVIDYFVKKDREKENEKENWHIKYGSRILSVLADQLTEEEKQTATDARFTIRPDYEPEPSISTMRGGTIIPQGPITQEEFDKLPIHDIAQKLQNEWSPEQLREKYKDDDFLRPRNAEGAGELLRGGISKRLQEYVNNANLFFKRDVLDQHYTYSFLRGTQEVLRGNKTEVSGVNWDNLITLCTAIKESGEAKPFDNERRERDAFDAWLAGWDAVHSAMTDVIQELLDKRSGGINIDFPKYRKQLFVIISYLLGYPDPTPEDEKLETAKSKTKSSGDSDYLVSDPFSMAINTVRGRAFQAFVLFVYQDGKKFAKDESPKISPDVKEFYEIVLKNENTRALMFMFGHYLPTFYFRDKAWIQRLLPQIFSTDPANKYLYIAAWEGYLSNNLYEDIFLNPDIQELYKRGLALTDTEYPKQKHFKEPDEGIATHLALAFMYYKDFGFGHELFDAFWEKNNPEQHADFVNFLGRMFVSGDNANANELLEKEPRSKQRLKDLWDWVLKKYEDPGSFVQFGFWISLEKNIFEPTWLAEHVKRTLEKTKGSLDWDYALTKSIIQLAKEAPKDTLAIARLYLLEGGVRGANDRVQLYIDKEWFEALKILYSNPATKSGTYSLIDDLIREGGSSFWGLKSVLDGSKPEEPKTI